MHVVVISKYTDGNVSIGSVNSTILGFRVSNAGLPLSVQSFQGHQTEKPLSSIL